MQPLNPSMGSNGPAQRSSSSQINGLVGHTQTSSSHSPQNMFNHVGAYNLPSPHRVLSPTPNNNGLPIDQKSIRAPIGLSSRGSGSQYVSGGHPGFYATSPSRTHTATHPSNQMHSTTTGNFISGGIMSSNTSYVAPSATTQAANRILSPRSSINALNSHPTAPVHRVLSPPTSSQPSYPLPSPTANSCLPPVRSSISTTNGAISRFNIGHPPPLQMQKSPSTHTNQLPSSSSHRHSSTINSPPPFRQPGSQPSSATLANNRGGTPSYAPVTNRASMSPPTTPSGNRNASMATPPRTMPSSPVVSPAEPFPFFSRIAPTSTPSSTMRRTSLPVTVESPSPVIRQHAQKTSDAVRDRIHSLLADSNTLTSLAFNSFDAKTGGNGNLLNLDIVQEVVADLCSDLSVARPCPEVYDFLVTRFAVRDVVVDDEGFCVLLNNEKDLNSTSGVLPLLRQSSGSSKLRLAGGANQNSKYSLDYISRETFPEFYTLCLCWIRDSFFPPTLRFKREFFIQTQKFNFDDVYVRMEKLGQGQFGVVHKVRELKTDILRCCKSIPKSKTSMPPEFVLNEIAILKQLDHPNIVRLIECFEDSTHLHLIFEYVRGQELMQVLLSRGSRNLALSEKEAARVLRPILSSVSHCHSRRVLHKDLKPENIMVVGGENGILTGSIKIIDFGLAELLTPSSPGSTTAAGTPYYMAPEVFSHKFDYKCDIWSVGVLMYLLLTAHLPFDAKDKPSYIKVVQRNSVSFPDKLFGHISQDAINLIKLLLTKDPFKRPSAAEALEDKWFAQQIEAPRTFDDVAFNEEVLSSSPDKDRLPGELSPLSPLAANSAGRQSIAQMASGAVSSSNIQRQQLPPSPLRHITRRGSRFLSYARHTSLQRICLNLVAMNLPFEEFANAPAIFRQLDIDNNGSLSEDELAIGLAALGMSKEDIVQVVDAMDADNSGDVSYSEFLATLIDTSSPQFEQHLWTVFRRFDSNGDGLMTAIEFEALMMSGGLLPSGETQSQNSANHLHASNSDDSTGAMVANATSTAPTANESSPTSAARKEFILEALEDLDGDGDGLISFKDFLSFLRKDFTHSPKRRFSVLSLPLSIIGSASNNNNHITSPFGIHASNSPKNSEHDSFHDPSSKHNNIDFFHNNNSSTNMYDNPTSSSHANPSFTGGGPLSPRESNSAVCVALASHLAQFSSKQQQSNVDSPKRRSSLAGWHQQ